MMKEVSQIYP